ncbi:MAG TPA: hypothetical protein VJ843_05555 [Candidatus Saccharimonadales bacterium]|nr:hypothetical protein [Candidatus Saccharimonadales bacterium]
MRVIATVEYVVRLVASGVIGIYVAAYGFPTVIVVAGVAILLSMIGFDLFGQHKIVTLAVFVFAAMVALHYGWTVPLPYYAAG